MIHNPNSIGFSGGFVRGYELLDTNYIVASDVTADNALKVGTFACKGTNPNECVGQKGDGEVIGLIPFQEYTSFKDAYFAGDRVLIDICKDSIYAIALENGLTCKKDDFIGIKKADGSLVFNADKAQVSGGDNKDTGYKVVQVGTDSIHIKRV